MLGDFVRVMRGVATGANEFFFLTKAQVREINLPDEFLQNAVGRTRDITQSEITDDTLRVIEAAGRPTRLLALDGRSPEEFSPSVQAYLKKGEAMGLPQRALIKQRRRWYKMESRRVPPFLFSYLGRRNIRFIRNVAQVTPLTGFLCIYPVHDDPALIERLWTLLQHPAIVANLHLVGKSYGNGAIKAEPRSLERLPISEVLVHEAGLPYGGVSKNLFEV